MKDDHKLKIIIVDDDDFLVNMYARKFGNNDVEVVACKSGSELLDKLRAGDRADLILLDIVLPELDGVGTLEIIRKEKLAEDIPIVMLTNQNDEGEMARIGKLGVAGYIVKALATPSEAVAEALRIIKDYK